MIDYWGAEELCLAPFVLNPWTAGCLFLVTLPASVELREASKCVFFLLQFHSSLHQANHLHLLNPAQGN